MANVGDLSVQLKADDRASGVIKNASKRINSSLSTIKKGSMIASAAILAGFSLSVKQFLETGDELHKLSQRTGITAQSLDALGHFAELSGQDIKIFETLTKFLTKQMVSLSEGADVQTQAFAKLGFAYKDLAELTKEQRMIGLIAALADIEDLTKRDIIGFDIFGGQMLKVQNLIGTFTGQELKAFIEGLKENSFWTDKIAEEAAVFNDTLADTKRELNMVVLELVRGHIPAMQKSAGRMLEWVKLNKDAILQTAKLLLTFAKIVLVLKTLSFVINLFLIPAFKLAKFAVMSLTATIKIGQATFGIWHGLTKVWAIGMMGLRKAFLLTTLAVKSLRLGLIMTMLTAVSPILVPLAVITAVIAALTIGFLMFDKAIRDKVIKVVKNVFERFKLLGELLGKLKGIWDKLMGVVKPMFDKLKEGAMSIKDQVIPSFKELEVVTDEVLDNFMDIRTAATEAIPEMQNLGFTAIESGLGFLEGRTGMDKFILGLQESELFTIQLSDALKDIKLDLEGDTKAADEAAAAFERYRNVINNMPRGTKGAVGPYDYLGSFPSIKSAEANIALMAAMKQLPSMQGATQADINKRMEGVSAGSSTNITLINASQLQATINKFNQSNAAN